MYKQIEEADCNRGRRSKARPPRCRPSNSTTERRAPVRESERCPFGQRSTQEGILPGIASEKRCGWCNPNPELARWLIVHQRGEDFQKGQQRYIWVIVSN